MDYNTIAVLYKNDPAFAALRKDWLPLAISYLHHAFKRKHEVTLSQDVFREGLDAYLDHVNATLPDDRQYTQTASYYMDRWSREDDLIRVRSRDDGYVVQLSPYAERLIGWFEEMQKRGIIGTESRLRTIMSMLDDVITHSTQDVQARLAQLHERRDQIDAEIERIEQTGEVDGLSDVQIRERLEHINSTASQLLRDFSAVEERFREMAREIQQAQLNPDLRLLEGQLEWEHDLRLDDLSLPVEQAAHLLGDHLRPRRVIVVENLINFLTLPRLPNAIGIFGGGFGVHLLRGVDWLGQCEVWYWGDIDAHGFGILSDLRGIFPHTRSVMMDRVTFDAHAAYIVIGVGASDVRLDHLTPTEADLAQYVIDHQLRLEQEHIPHDYAVRILRGL